MTVLDAKAFLAGCVAVACLLGAAGPVLTQSAMAQSSGPLRLLPAPSSPLDAPEGDVSDFDEAGAVDDNAPGESVPLEGVTAPSGIRIDRLDDAGPAASGLLAPQDQGLSAEMWAGTSVDGAIALMEALPARFGSLAVRDLVERLLVTTAIPPEGAGSDFGYRRVAALIGIGAVERAVELRGDLPFSEDGVALWVENDLAFLTGRTEAGCDQATSIQRASPGIRPNQILAACHALRGNHDIADRAFRFLAEEGEGDPLLRGLARALDGDVSGIDWSAGRLAPIHVAVANASAQLPEASILRLAHPGVQRAFAMTDGGGLEDKLAAAEAAVASGALAPGVLAALYDAADTGGRLQDAAAADPDMLTALDRAALYQAISDAGSAILILQAAQTGYPRLAVALGEEAAARLYAPLILPVDPRPDVAWAAPAVLPILAHAHSAARFRGWYALAQDHPEQVPADVLAAYADGYAVIDLDIPTTSLTALLLRKALGKPLMPAEQMRILRAAASQPGADAGATSGVYAMALDHALSGGRAAEAVLLIAIGLAQSEGGLSTGLDGRDPGVLMAVQALRNLGFREEARALALSAAVSGRD
ncbi:MAG: hypothetical protein NXI16_17835 [Alphaproteobacteria bacterium]|nr:hypothetical protein [Alphaproteobacteria bacterium]